jgi:hypothetical protein
MRPACSLVNVFVNGSVDRATHKPEAGSDGDDGHQIVEAAEVVGVAGVQGQSVGQRYGSDL